MSELITDQLIKKLGLQNEPRISSKSTELMRLLDLKSSKVVGAVGDYAKTVICIDLAATYLGIPFDYLDGLKHSGLRKSIYQNYKRTFEKLLDLNKELGIHDICIQLGLTEVSQKATELHEIYKALICKNEDDRDLSHPQYAAMAVYQACKELKRQISKPKILAYSHLKSSQWAKLEQQWQTICKIDSNELKLSKKVTHKSTRTKEIAPDLKSSEKIQNIQIVDDYELWRNKWIATAFKQYKILKADQSNKSSNFNEILDYLSSDSDNNDCLENYINTYNNLKMEQ